MYSNVFYPLWLANGEGKIETPLAAVLSILNKTIHSIPFIINLHEIMLALVFYH